MDIQLFTVVSIIIDFLLIIYLFWLNRRILIEIVRSVSFRGKVILLLIILIFSVIVVFNGYNFKVFIPSDEEWELMRQAKNFLNGDQVLRYLRYGFVYPLLLSFGFIIFGINPLVGSIMSFVFGVLSILLIFTISQLIFKNEKTSLVSSLLYSMSPLVYIFTSLQMGYPGLVNFFLLLFVLASVLSFQKQKFSLFILSLILIAFTAQIKPEYFVLIVPYLFGAILFWKERKINYLSIFILITTFLILSAPYLLQNIYLKEGHSSGWCGDLSLVGRATFHSDWLSKYIDPVIKFVVNDRFSVNYLINKIPSLFQFWMFRSLALITPIMIVGIFVALRKFTKMTIYILSIFFSITFLYLADCYLYEARYAFPTFGLVVIFFGFGINYLISLIDGGANIKQLVKKIILILFSVFLIIFLYFYEYRNSLFQGEYFDYLFTVRNVSSKSEYYSVVSTLLNKLPRENTFVVVPHPNDKNMIMIMGYESISLIDYVAFQTNETINYETVNIPLDFGKLNYFLELDSCNYSTIKEKCDFIKEKYSAEQLKTTDFGGSLYLLNSK